MDNSKGEVLEVRCWRRDRMYNILGKREHGTVKKKNFNVLEWLEIKEDVGDSWKLSQE